MAASDGVAIRRMNSRWRKGAAIVGAGVAAVGVAGSTAIATAFVCWVQPARGRALASNAPAAPDNANMTFLGLSLDPSDPWVIFEFSLINILVTSVVPVPIAGPVTAAGALLFGLVAGMALSVVTALIGAYIGLVATRTACRPCFMHLLGRYRKHWVAIDTALAEQGSQIALLIRVAPVAPMVLTNILLGLTSISTWTYLWTCAIGLIPSNLPYAYGAQLGASLASEFPPSDPVMLTMTILGFVASVAIAWKVGRVAQQVLRRHGVGGAEEPRASEGDAEVEGLGLRLRTASDAEALGEAGAEAGATDGGGQVTPCAPPPSHGLELVPPPADAAIAVGGSPGEIELSSNLSSSLREGSNGHASDPRGAAGRGGRAFHTLQEVDDV